MNDQKHFLYIVSDSTGETAATVIRAVLVHFMEHNIQITRFKNVRTQAQVEGVVREAFNQQALIVHTMVSPKLRQALEELGMEKGITTIDLLGPVLKTMGQWLNVNPTPEKEREAGILRQVDARYFKRIEAIEYTVKHDDGKSVDALDEADIILVGISRTSKTPLSIFLSSKGWKVANIPLVVGAPLPAELFKVDQRKIIGLIIDTSSLQKIRSSRLARLGTNQVGEYASLSYIEQELSYAEEVFAKNKRWPVFNVTERALEETATEITRLVSARMGLPDSVIF